MIRIASFSNRRIIRDDDRSRRRERRSSTTPRPTNADPRLTTRRSVGADLPWIEAWASTLALPAPMSRAVTSYVLLRDGQRVGYVAMRDTMVDSAHGRAPVRWVVSAFLIPAARRQGLLMRFGEILSREVFPRGRVGARVATQNTRMLRLMQVGGWRKLRVTRDYIDFILDLRAPFRAGRTPNGS